ncbi:hypothetical protein GOQ30_05045 [Flavobacterium sp. TP390]|uniref:Uncharacterized protein n=1 Tax=Flavobacterium profundi TaxID=1774945 RepID=A0A6I4IG39_9FLAO|nr:hypothetical protein [Flavobacterium profundi]MVO08530.1 hypothetical protein [Flavobacterium profundi]
MKKWLLSILIVLILQSCSDTNKIKNVTPAFYYWKTSDWRLDDNLMNILKNTQVKKVYAKFFEVSHDELMGNIPISKNSIRFNNLNVEFIPTVFINNDVFLKSSEKELDVLADNMNFLITKMLSNDYSEDDYFNAKSCKEFQIDCDWTLKSRNNYFYFLKKIKEISKKEISCTLRLYPYKYPEKMGIPPVDKVTLMCYNLLNPLSSPKQNSILDVKELSSYLKGTKQYPLHLDIALPIYSWMQLYQNNQFQKVIYQNHELIMKNLKKNDNLWYEVINDFTASETYFRIGDKIKFEEIDQKLVHQTIDLLKRNVEFDDETTISLFHLDNSQLKKYTDEEISSFYSAFN